MRRGGGDKTFVCSRFESDKMLLFVFLSLNNVIQNYKWDVIVVVLSSRQMEQLTNTLFFALSRFFVPIGNWGNMGVMKRAVIFDSN